MKIEDYVKEINKVENTISKIDIGAGCSGDYKEVLQCYENLTFFNKRLENLKTGLYHKVMQEYS